MIITNVVYVPGYSGFFFDDQRAIKAGAENDGFVYQGQVITPGFTAIRQAGRSISLMLVLENGRVAHGDCAAVQYSGTGGRDPLFLPERYIPFLEQHITPKLLGRKVDDFLPNARFFDSLEIEGKRIHTALRYGISQALLHAAALAQESSMTQVICREFELPLILEPIPLFAQTGDDRYTAVDKMILKEVDVLPHGLINNIETKLGRDGEKLRQYVGWLRNRIAQLKTTAEYCPDLHIDVYGTPGMIFDHDPLKVADYLASLEADAHPHKLYIEGPVDMGNKPGQIQALGEIRDLLQKKGSSVKIVADEWCNTFEDVRDFTDARCCDMVQIKTPDLGGVHTIVESVRYCLDHGMEAYQGGTCNETDTSARVCVHLALAARPMRMLVKPGMGFDEGMVVVHNEMARTLAILKATQDQESPIEYFGPQHHQAPGTGLKHEPEQKGREKL